MRTVNVVVTLGIAAGLAGRGPGLAAQACSADPVALQERSALTLPATFGIRGVASDGTGSLALWSPEGEVLQVDPEHRLSQLQLPGGLIPAGAALTPEGLLFLDQASAREFLLQADGTVRRRGAVRLGLSEGLDAAVPSGQGWAVALADLAARRFVLREVTDTSSRVLYRSAPAATRRAIPRYHLSDTGHGLVLVRVTAPFDVVRVDPGTGRVDTLAPPLGDGTPLIPTDSLAHWRAVSAVGLDCALLVTLSDLTADRRLLVRYSGDTVAQRTLVEAPLGLVARLGGRPTVLAARRAGELELVWYDWHWIRESHSSTP